MTVSITVWHRSGMATTLNPTDFEHMAVDAGVTMTQACDRAGISHTIFTRWKAGKGVPTITSYDKLHRALEELIAERHAANPITN